MSQPKDHDQIFFWWNTRTKAVERGPKSKALERVGPFETEAEARNAEKMLAERAARWLAEEEAERS